MKIIQNNNEEIMMEDNPQSFDPAKFLLKYVKYWPFFVLSIIISFSAAYFYNNTTPPVYQVGSKFLIKDDRNLGVLDLTGLSQPGFLGSANQKVSNEGLILKSKPIAEKVLNKFDLSVEYFQPGVLLDKELYKESPILVQTDWSHPQTIYDKVKISWIDQNSFFVEFPGSKYLKYFPATGTTEPLNLENFPRQKYNFGDWVELPHGRFKVALIGNVQNGEILIKFLTKGALLSKLTGEDFMIYPLEKNSSIVGLILKTSHPQKGADYLNALMELFLELELEEKNRVAKNTVDFIDRQISGFADTLSTIEKNLQSFRSSNKTLNIGQESNAVFQEITDLGRQLAQERWKRQYYQNLKAYLTRENYDQIIVPSGIGIDDPILNTLIADLITLQTERAGLLSTQTEASPRVREVSRRIQDVNNNLFEIVRNVDNNSQMLITDLEERIARIESQFTKLPGTEQNLLKIQREFTLNETIYTFLLQRRAEAAIALASNSASNKIVEYSNPSNTPIKLMATIIYAGSIVLGIIFPMVLFGIIIVLDKRIKDPKEFEKELFVPLLGKIAKNKEGNYLAVLNQPRSAIAESFRALKTNISFVVPLDKQLTIALSSTLSGEGKTFTAINLASAYSLNGKKTILISCDMFKPNTFSEFQLKKKEGLSNFLSKQLESVFDIIQSTDFPNFDIINSSAIPPNPSDLLGSDRFIGLIEDLKKIYDVIILDTPPVGLISQSFEVIKHVDLILYVFRYNYSEKSYINEVNDIKTKKAVKNIYAVLNDVSDKDLTYKGYNYGYYDAPKTKGSFFKGLFSRNKAAI
jgi:tyrosine-protein kinase Etk/Wzc